MFNNIQPQELITFRQELITSTHHWASLITGTQQEKLN